MHPDEKALMDKSVDKLIEKAADCFDLAKIQHDIAENQREIASKHNTSADKLETSACKLEGLAHALEADAVEIKGNTEVVAPRIKVFPRKRSEDGETSATSTIPRSGNADPEVPH